MKIKLTHEASGWFYAVDDDGREFAFGGPEPDKDQAVEAAKAAVRFHFEDELAHAQIEAA